MPAMGSQLELRSTFHFNSDGLGTLSLPAENKRFVTSVATAKKAEKTPALLKKNSLAVSASLTEAIFDNLGQEVTPCLEAYCSKKFSTRILKAFSKQSDNFLSLRNISDQLVGFDFHKDSSYIESVKSRFFVKKGGHSGHVIFHMPAFVPQNDLNVPEGATNFKIFARLVSVSDFEKSGEDYHALNFRQHGCVSSYQTAMLPVLRITTQPITTQLRIDDPEFTAAGMSSIFVVGVKYYSYKDRKFENLPMSTRLCVMGVY